MTLDQTRDYLDTLPAVLALFWFMENVDSDHPHRTSLFFYCRERARRYSGDGWKNELQWDKQMFERMKA